MLLKNYTFGDALYRQENTFNPAVLLSDLYPCQKRIIYKRADDNVVCTPRQVGKSLTISRALVYFALTFGQPNTVSAYLTDTRRHAQDLLWIPLLSLLAELGIPHKANHSELSITFDNQCRIELFGIDDSRKASRLRGYQYICLFVDEAQSIPDQVLLKVIQEDTHAGRQAYGAPLYLIGTPGPVNQGIFYEAIHDKSKDYKSFTWNQYDNIHFPRWRDLDSTTRKEAIDQWLQDIAQKKFGGTDNPAFQREYMGLWISDAGKLMFHLSDKNIFIGTLPATRNILAIDLGFNDATSWNVLGYSNSTNKIYHLYEHELTNQLVPDVISHTIPLIEKYNPERLVVDGAGIGLMVLETISAEIRRRYNLPVVPAPKTEKGAWIRLLDSDLRVANVYVIPHGETWKQLSTTIWNDKATLEKQGQKVDLLDSFLYAYRYCYHYNQQNKPKPRLTEEELDDLEYFSPSIHRQIKSTRR